MAKKQLPLEFEGFPKDTFAFLSDLAANNDRDWFAANRDRYEQSFLQPSLGFIRAMQSKLPKVSSQLVAIPKQIGGSLMRIYRDTRFSKDKTPYKDNIGIHFRHQRLQDVHAPGLYFEVGAARCFIAAGVWLPPSETLAQIRTAIVEDPTAWKRVRQNPKLKAKFAFGGESLKSAPRGFDSSHPHIEDLKRTSFMVSAPLTRKQVTSRELPDIAAELYRESRPLMKFLCDAVFLPY